MAAWILWQALELLDFLPQDRRQELTLRLGIDRRRDSSAGTSISRKMRVAFHGDGIISQFEGYDALEGVRLGGLRGQVRRHPAARPHPRGRGRLGEPLQGVQAGRRADAVLPVLGRRCCAQLFERLGYPFDADTIPKNIDYYRQRTSHGSTLSNVVHSWVSARSDRPGSWQLFTEALRSDLDDVQGGTTPEGIHLGAMAGTVDLLERGYTGMELRHNALHFNPTLPEQLTALKIRIRYRGHSLTVEISDETLSISSMPSDKEPIQIGCGDEVRALRPGDVTQFRFDPRFTTTAA